MPIPIKRIAITWGYFFGSMFILLALLGATGDSGFLSFLVVANFVLTFWLLRIGHQLQKIFIPTATCPHCHSEISLVGLWDCSCGYNDPKERHAFDRCSSCHGTPPFINCPKCDSSIRLSWAPPQG